MSRLEHVNDARLRQHAALYALATSINPHNKFTGLQIWRKLRRIEAMANSGATAQCNGSEYGGQPYREDADWDNFLDGIQEQVAAVFGGHLPPSFVVNTDPRGYALKLRSGADGETATHFELEQDWGRNQILAPEIN